MEEPITFVIRATRPDTVETVREYAVRRLAFALGSFERHVRRVKVRLVDLNGPRRGADCRCSITVDLVDGRRVFVEATTPWPFASVTRAAARRNDAVRREVRRSASHRVPRPDSRRALPFSRG
jgi:putative sigma-54 modulation protein